MAKKDVAAAVLSAPAWRPPAFDEDDPLDYRMAWLNRNDAGNAERLLTRFGDQLLYVRDVGWHWWDGRRWSFEQGDVMVDKLAHDTARRIHDEVAALQDADGAKRVDKDSIDAHFKWALTSGNIQRLRAMVAVAQAYRTVSPAAMDASPLLLNLGNGVMRLDGLCEALAPHRREDMITKVVDIAYDETASCPAFERFLAEILPDQSVRDFLQRSFGYALTGLIGEQVLWFFYGTGANGKSTLVNVIARILGPYCASLPFSSLIQDERKRGSDASPDLARLPGARFVRASEPEKGTRFGESTIKTVTGGEPLTVRHLNHGFFDFTPEFKLFLSGNHKPVIRGQDEGVWRRIMLVPFTVSIPKERRDPALESKLWQERAGILNWMLAGLRQWQAVGLRPPDAVVGATAEYREDSDPLGIFVSQWCERIDKATIQATDLFEAYRIWCGENAVEPVTNTLFGRMLTERGILKDKVGVIRYLGLQLTETASLAVSNSRRRRHRQPEED